MRVTKPESEWLDRREELPPSNFCRDPNVGGIDDSAAASDAGDTCTPLPEVDVNATQPAPGGFGFVVLGTRDGERVAVKVQRPALKELIDADLKNLNVLAELLYRLDNSPDSMLRDWREIFESNARIIYEEIDYIAEGKNAKRFDDSLKAVGIDYVKVPEVFWEATTPRVLTMEFVPSFKLTDIAQVEAQGLDRNLLATTAACSNALRVQPSMSVAVFGATGLTGRECTHQLLGRNIPVRALCRDPAGLLTPMGSTGKEDPVESDQLFKYKGSVTNADDVEKVFEIGRAHV